MPKETYKLIVQVPGILISDQGNIKYADTNEQKLFSVVRGYRFINHRGRKYFVHKLVALAFIDNPENKKVVIHLDGDLTNNKASNLKWANNYEAQIHSYTLGKKKINHTILTPDNIKEILKCFKEGMPGSKIALKFKVSEMTISRIKNGKHRFSLK